MMLKNGLKTPEQFLDWYLDKRKRKAKASANEYRGYKWKSLSDLSIQLGKSKTYASSIMDYYGIDVEQFLDWYIDERKIDKRKNKHIYENRYTHGHMHSYRGYEWKNISDLSTRLGKCKGYVSNTMAVKGFNTVEQFLDWYIEDQPSVSRVSQPTTTYRGYSYKNIEDLSEQLGFESVYAMTNRINELGLTDVNALIDYTLDGGKNDTNSHTKEIELPLSELNTSDVIHTDARVDTVVNADERIETLEREVSLLKEEVHNLTSQLNKVLVKMLDM